MAVTLRLLGPFVALHALVTVSVAYALGHVDLRPHVVAGLLAIPALQGAALASVLPPPKRAGTSPADPGGRRALASVPALLLALLLAGLAADLASGWFDPALSHLLHGRPLIYRATAGYGALLVVSFSALLGLRSRASASGGRGPRAAILLDASAGLLLASAIGAIGQFYQRPFLVRPWSTILPAGVLASAASSVAALALLALPSRVPPGGVGRGGT